MPTSKEGDALYQLEDEITRFLLVKENAIFLSRVTCQGKRDLAYRIHDPELADQGMQQLVAASSPIREWEYHMVHDEDWSLAQPELKLLEKDPKYS